MLRQMKAVQHMNLQRTKAATEGDMLFRRDALIAQHHQAMFDQGGTDFGNAGVADRLMQIEAVDFGSERAVERTDVEFRDVVISVDADVARQGSGAGHGRVIRSKAVPGHQHKGLLHACAPMATRN